MTADGRMLRLLNIVDELAREALAIHVDRCITAETVSVLENLVAQRGGPENLRDYRRSVAISTDAAPTAVTRQGFEFALMLEPGESWTAAFTITPHSAQPGATFALRRTRGALTQLRASKAAELEQWLAQAPPLPTQDPALVRHLPRQPRRPARSRRTFTRLAIVVMVSTTAMTSSEVVVEISGTLSLCSVPPPLVALCGW